MTAPDPRDIVAPDAFDQLISRHRDLTAEIEKVEQALPVVAFSMLLNQQDTRVSLARKWGISRPTFNRYMEALEARYGITLPPSKHRPKPTA